MSNFSQNSIFYRSSGKICVRAVLSHLGQDVLVVFTGGGAHLGAVAMAGVDFPVKAMELPGHREGPLAAAMAERLAAALNCSVTVCAGIHYDNATRKEIDLILELCDLLTSDIIHFAGEGVSMLNMKDLEEFEKYIRSGDLEKDFREGCETDRHYILELLEKFMDVADLADEAATRLIFRGLPLPGETKDS